MLNRRQWLQGTTAAALAACAAGRDAAGDDAPSLLATGPEVPELAAFDRWIGQFMAQHNIPGGQLAVAKGEKVLYSRGFGLADRESKQPVAPHALFRIASVSKPITAVAILELVERGKLKVEDRIDEILAIEPHLESGAKEDERWKQVTVAHCLTHTGGWDRDASYDPMFAYHRVAESLGTKLPVGTAEIIRYMRGQPLDFTPGERYAYSNFGYCLLGRVIEKLTGRDYESFVREQIFAPLGITAPRIGHSLADERQENEVCYYTAHDEKEPPVVGPHAGSREHPVPISYGCWNHEALDAHGGWIASAEDLVRFGAALGTPDKPLATATAQQMFAPQARIRGNIHYGYGWTLGREDDDPKRPIISHGGALPCTAATLVKTYDGLTIAALFNLGKTRKGEWIGRGLDGEVIGAARQVSTWPA